MRIKKRFVPGLVMGISVFICMASVLGSPSILQAAYSTLYDFGSVAYDGSNPVGSLTLSGTTLYGMTNDGGISSKYGVEDGAIFRINADGTGYQVMYSFLGLLSSDGNDGSNPYGSLTLSGSTLYGMTSGGGETGVGTIFQINTDGKGYQILHNFGFSENDGYSPYGSLTLSGSTLYGMTSGGGANYIGTIFQINTDGTGYQVLYSFGSIAGDGDSPNGSLTLSGSKLYGMTSGGGAYGNGTIFQINTDGTGCQVLYSFGGIANDGAVPQGSLTLSGSTLYGMTNGGGAYGNGAIFQINTNGTGYQMLYSFGSIASDGAAPQGSLTLSGSKLYGMTSGGGPALGGTIFQINTNGTGYQILHNFGTVTTDGAKPEGSLTLSGSTLYGVTNGGGNTSFSGIIFSLGVTSGAVNGLCGSSSGGTFSSAPTSNLCNAGTATSVSGSGPWNWTCQGSNGGTNVSCSANVQSQGINGACGSASGEDLLKAPTTSNLCSAGKASKVTGKGPWDWTCAGSNGGSTVSCSADIEANGACGSAKGKSYLTTPTSNLCKSGEPSSVTNNGDWQWTCTGSNGGTIASCSAKIEIKGTCGSANTESFLTEPTSDLCSAGTVSKVTGTGPWDWSCEGSSGGATERCSAKLEVNGACGAANGESFLTEPRANLCGAGKASKVTGTGPWDWTCAGLNGGGTVDCSANLK